MRSRESCGCFECEVSALRAVVQNLKWLVARWRAGRMATNKARRPPNDLGFRSLVANGATQSWAPMRTAPAGRSLWGPSLALVPMGHEWACSHAAG